jgi:hypothetical protein
MRTRTTTASDEEVPAVPVAVLVVEPPRALLVGLELVVGHTSTCGHSTACSYGMPWDRMSIVL